MAAQWRRWDSTTSSWITLAVANPGQFQFPSAWTGHTVRVFETATNTEGVGQRETVSLGPITSTNVAPTITSNSGNHLSLSYSGSSTLATLTATGSPTPTWSIASGPNQSMFTIDSQTGVLSLIPTAPSSGTYSIQVVASNGTAPNATIGVTLTVAVVSPPVENGYPVANQNPSWALLSGNSLNSISTATWTSSTPIIAEGDSLLIGVNQVPLSNLAPNSISSSTYALTGTTISAADGSGFVTLQKSSSASDQWAQAPVPSTPTQSECVIELRAGGATSAHIGLYGANVWSDGNATVCYGKIIRGPGTVTKFSGALFTISNLSTTASTFVHLVRKVPNTSGVRIYPGAYNSTTASHSIKIRRLTVFDAGSSEYGRERYVDSAGRLESIYLSSADVSTVLYEQFATNSTGTRRVRSNGTIQDTPTSTAASFTMYSTLNYTGQPAASTFGAVPLNIIYEQSFYPDVPNRSLRSTVSAAGWANIDLIMASMPPGPVCLDLELEKWMFYPWAKNRSIASDPSSVPNVQSPTGENHTAVVNLHADIATEFKARYGRLTGYYGPPPCDNLLPNASLAEHVHPRAEMVRHNDAAQALIDAVDFFMPCAYIAHAGFDQHQPAILASIASEARRLAPTKKLYLFISPQVQNTQTNQYPDLTYIESKTQIDRLIDLGYDGAVLWGGYDIGIPPRESDGNIQLVWGGSSMPWLQAWNDIRTERGFA